MTDALKTDEERISPDDRVLVVIPNQYMLYQTIWYHSQYPEGIWDAIVVPYGQKETGKKVQAAICRECERIGLFSRIVSNDELRVGGSRVRQVGQFFGYLFQYLTGRREEHDRKLIESIMGRCDYKKVLVHPANMMCTAAINGVKKARTDAVLVCMEDGLLDYMPATSLQQAWRSEKLLFYVLAKMNVLNAYHFVMKYEPALIKYVSLPERMQYRNYKKIKQVFGGTDMENRLHHVENKEGEKKYDLIVFSAPLLEDFQSKVPGGVFIPNCMIG